MSTLKEILWRLSAPSGLPTTCELITRSAIDFELTFVHGTELVGSEAYARRDAAIERAAAVKDRVLAHGWIEADAALVPRRSRTGT